MDTVATPTTSAAGATTETAVPDVAPMTVIVETLITPEMFDVMEPEESGTVAEVTLVIRTPKRTDRGFLRRQRHALMLKRKTEEGDISPELVDDMVNFILPYVESPRNRAAATELLLDASEEDFNSIITAITATAKGGNTPVPMTSDAPTVAG